MTRRARSPFAALPLAFAFAFSVALVARPALAQGTSADAEELFKQGRAALDASDYPTACRKLAASLQIERAVGTLMSLAKCEEAQNQLASAREHWQEAADFAVASNDRLNRGAACRARFAEIDKRVPRLTIKLAAAAPPGTVVTRDGVVLAAAMLGSAMPVNPGTHTIETTAAGYETRAASVTLKEGDSKDVEASPGAPTSVASAPAPLPSPAPAPIPAATPAPVPPAATPPASAPAGSRTLFWAGVGVTGVGVVAGGVLGGLAVGKSGSLSGECGGHVCATASAQSDLSTAKSMALASDIAFGVAGAGVVLAVIGFVTAPHASARENEKPGVSVWLGPGSGGVRGTF